MDGQVVTLSAESIKELAHLLRPTSKAERPASPLDVLYLSIANAARRQDVSQETIRRMIDRGELKAHKFGKSIRIKITDLDRASKPIKTMAEMLGGAV